MQDTKMHPWWGMGPTLVRAAINDGCMKVQAPALDVGSVSEFTVESAIRKTRVRIYRPDVHKNIPAILMIHGGAWVGGNLDTHDNLARYLCVKTQALVVSVGYVNAPEGKFPLQLEQSYDVLLWMIENKDKLSLDPSKIAIVGDSSGGNMTAALCLMARDRKGPKAALQVLINPSPDLSFEKEDFLNPLQWQGLQYVNEVNELINPYVSPLLAPDLHNLPPALVILAELDELRGLGQKYADRLMLAGIPTRVYCQHGVGHLAADAARVSQKAIESIDMAVAAIKVAFLNNNT